MTPFRRFAPAILALALVAACRGAEDRVLSPASPEVANRVTPREVVLYFEGPSGLLTPERRELPLPENEGAAMHGLVAALVTGSANAGVPRPFPEDTIVRGAFLLPDGTAVVDLGGATLQEGWNTGSRAEMIAAYSLVQTLVANLSSVRQVQILVGGSVAETLAGHLDLSRPLRPLAYLVSPS